MADELNGGAGAAAGGEGAGAGGDGGAAAAAAAAAASGGNGGGEGGAAAGSQGGEGAAKGGTGLNPDANGTTVQPNWPDNWREIMAAGDEKELKRLERFQSPQNVMKSWREAEKRLSSGKLVTPLSKEATDEDKAAWRKDNGIPDAPEGYDLSKLPSGFEPDETQKPLVDLFIKKMHGSNATPDQVRSSVDAYGAIVREMAEQQVVQDQSFKQVVEDNLRKEWGNEYRANVNKVDNFIASLPKGFQEVLTTSRTSDGRVLANHPAIIMGLLDLKNEIDPAGVIVPGVDANNQAGAIDDEIKTIQKHMANYGTAPYYTGPESAKMQARYQELLGHKEKMKAG